MVAACHPAGFAIEAMRPAGVDAVLAVQAQAYAGIDVLEDAGLFLNRIRLSPRTCWVARGPGGVLGYLVSYPWPLGAPLSCEFFVTTGGFRAPFPSWRK